MGPNESYPAFHDAKLNWDDLDWLKGLSEGTPIYLKGVCHIDVRQVHPICIARREPHRATDSLGHTLCTDRLS